MSVWYLKILPITLTSAVLRRFGFVNRNNRKHASDRNQQLARFWGESPDGTHAPPRRTRVAVDCGSRKKAREMLSVRIHLIIVELS